MEVLRIKIHQPMAHYRVPFSYQRRFTYPIPPYSTVKGMLCNLLGIKSDGNERWNKVKELYMGIYGKYETLVKDWNWLRNLSKEAHEKHFGYKRGRVKDFVVQHPGGITPVRIDILYNVNLIIYLYHRDERILKKIKQSFDYPYSRNDVLHLGRAEDWIVPQEVKFIALREGDCFKIPYFCWIPDKEEIERSGYREIYKYFLNGKYEAFFNSLSGNFVRLGIFYKIEDNQRIFKEYKRVKLFEGGSFRKSKFPLVDIQLRLPVFFLKLNTKEREDDDIGKE